MLHFVEGLSSKQVAHSISPPSEINSDSRYENRVDGSSLGSESNEGVVYARVIEVDDRGDKAKENVNEEITTSVE